MYDKCIYTECENHAKIDTKISKNNMMNIRIVFAGNLLQGVHDGPSSGLSAGLPLPQQFLKLELFNLFEGMD